MMKVNNYQIVKSLAYCTRIRCASIDLFIKYLEPYFIDNLESDVSMALDKCISSLSPLVVKTQEEALKKFLVCDLKDMKNNLRNVYKYICDPVKQIKESLFRYQEKLREWGIDLNLVDIRIEDKFPEPYSNINAWAMNFDVYDQQVFGIPRGIVFLRKKLLPIVSSYLLAHELIHAIFSRKYSHHLARGLEEGICEVLGFILASEYFGRETTQNLLINFRLSETTNRFWRIYTEATREAMLLYKRYGLKGLKSILRLGYERGREIIKKIEAELMQQRYQFLDKILSYGEFESSLNDFFDFFIGYPKSLVVSPLAYYIAEKIGAGDNIDDLVKEFDRAQAIDALYELQDQVYLILIQKGRIISDETKPFIETKTLRYIIQR